MVVALGECVAATDKGEPWFACGGPSSGLERRGLIAFTPVGQDKPEGVFGVRYIPTLAGRLVHALTQQAGLQPDGEPDPVMEDIKARHARMVEMEREREAEEERREAERERLQAEEYARWQREGGKLRIVV